MPENVATSRKYPTRHPSSNVFSSYQSIAPSSIFQYRLHAPIQLLILPASDPPAGPRHLLQVLQRRIDSSSVSVQPSAPDLDEEDVIPRRGPARARVDAREVQLVRFEDREGVRQRTWIVLFHGEGDEGLVAGHFCLGLECGCRGCRSGGGFRGPIDRIRRCSVPWCISLLDDEESGRIVASILDVLGQKVQPMNFCGDGARYGCRLSAGIQSYELSCFRSGRDILPLGSLEVRSKERFALAPGLWMRVELLHVSDAGYRCRSGDSWRRMRSGRCRASGTNGRGAAVSWESRYRC